MNCPRYRSSSRQSGADGQRSERKHIFVTVPAGDTFKTVTGPSGEDKQGEDKLIDVPWEAGRLLMFVGDLKRRAIETT
jgi:hypothetical protein